MPLPESAVKKIYSSLNKISPVTVDGWMDLQRLFSVFPVGKHEYIVREGQLVSSCYFLLEGVVRVFYNKDGIEYNKTFFVQGMFPTALTALLTNSPSALSFQALTPCRLVKFSYQEFMGLFEKHRCLETLFLAILEQLWIKKERHDIRMVTNNATENYRLFREDFPGLEELIPQYHVASYLGVSPVQLSRVRAGLASQHR